MSKRVCIIDLPGLSKPLLSVIPPQTALGQWLSAQRVVGMTPPLPAVTCAVQATLTTGTHPAQHGIIANGLPTFRSAEDQALVDPNNMVEYRRQVSLWEQSNQFLQAPRFWQVRPIGGQTALLFFQNSMPGFTGNLRPAADIVLTPKPDHGPDGKLVSLCWSDPHDLVGRLFQDIGPFPLMHYWGPMSGIGSSRWIAQAAADVWKWHSPQLQWTYVPHLDYDLQRFGPSSPQAKQAVADVSAALDPLIRAVLDSGGELLILSEYAMSDVSRSIPINRHLADAGLLVTRQGPDGAIVDYERSQAFAMCDHQIAHIYTQTPQETDDVRQLLQSMGVSTVLDRAQQEDLKVNHRRSGDLLAIADEDAWFDYRWWSDPADAPSFARTVDIHRKPGYDPLELFFVPTDRAITQDPTLIRGSHGRVKGAEAVLIGDPRTIGTADVHATDVAKIVVQAVG